MALVVGKAGAEEAGVIEVRTSLSVINFFFNDTATTEIYTLSLHDALPICKHLSRFSGPGNPEVSILNTITLTESVDHRCILTYIYLSGISSKMGTTPITDRDKNGI